MKYYPLSQIQTGLTSKKGEFVILKGNPTPALLKKIHDGTYVGPYFKTSDGKFFTGKNPSDKEGVLELQPLFQNIESDIYDSKYEKENSVLTKTNDIINKIIEENSSYSYYTHNYEFRQLTKKPYYSEAPKPPTSINFIPNKDMNLNGFENRYFAKHRINNFIIEISKNTFNEIKNKSKNIQFELYRIMEIKWNINDDYSFNKEQIRKAIKLGFTGLDEFLNREVEGYNH